MQEPSTRGRFLDNVNTTRTKVLFAHLNWISLRDRTEYHRAVQVFKCMNNFCSQGMDTLFDVSKNVQITIPGQPNIVVCKSSAHLGATTTWNNIPSRVRNAGSVASFKSLYVNHYFENCANPWANYCLQILLPSDVYLYCLCMYVDLLYDFMYTYSYCVSKYLLLAVHSLGIYLRLLDR